MHTYVETEKEIKAWRERGRSICIFKCMYIMHTYKHVFFRTFTKMCDLLWPMLTSTLCNFALNYFRQNYSDLYSSKRKHNVLSKYTNRCGSLWFKSSWVLPELELPPLQRNHLCHNRNVGILGWNTATVWLRTETLHNKPGPGLKCGVSDGNQQGEFWSENRFFPPSLYLAKSSTSR